MFCDVGSKYALYFAQEPPLQQNRRETTSAVWRSRFGGIHDFASPPRDGFTFSADAKLLYSGETALTLKSEREKVTNIHAIPTPATIHPLKSDKLDFGPAKQTCMPPDRFPATDRMRFALRPESGFIANSNLTHSDTTDHPYTRRSSTHALSSIAHRLRARFTEFDSNRYK
jgi:hypothetical protein